MSCSETSIKDVLDAAYKRSAPTPSTIYFEELIHDRANLTSVPNPGFRHLHNLLDKEIERVRIQNAKTTNNTELTQSDLPEKSGEIVYISEKIYAPDKKYPNYNFAGRILGPRGMTVKQLEQMSGCKIQVRGRGSQRGKHIGHQSEPLHVIISVEDTSARAAIKLSRAKDELNRLLHPKTKGMDELRKKQLMELSIINGNYRPPPHATQTIPNNPMANSAETNTSSCSSVFTRITTPPPLIQPNIVQDQHHQLPPALSQTRPININNMNGVHNSNDINNMAFPTLPAPPANLPPLFAHNPTTSQQLQCSPQYIPNAQSVYMMPPPPLLLPFRMPKPHIIQTTSTQTHYMLTNQHQQARCPQYYIREDEQKKDGQQSYGYPAVAGPHYGNQCYYMAAGQDNVKTGTTK